MANTPSSSSRDNVDNGCSTDYSSEFKTTQKFTSREELGEWVCKVGRSNGFGMVTLRSDGGGGNSKKRPRVTLGCERSGKSDTRLPRPEKKIRKGYGSKKCGCPFILKGQLAADGSGWELTEVKGVHNHAVENSDFPARLTKEEKSLVKNMHSEKLKPKEILKDLKERDKHNKSTLRTIYNARNSLDGKRVQQRISLLFNKLSLHGHIHCDMTCPKTNTRNFFLTNPTSLKLLRAFPSVLRIRIGPGVATDRDPHLCITGITSTEIQFSVAYVRLCSQRRDNLLWALNRLRDEMDDIAVLRVIVLQIEQQNLGAATGDLIGAIKDVFRTTEVLLCRSCVHGFFILRVFYKLYRKRRSFNEAHFLDFQRKWKTLVQSPSESEFKKKLMELQTEFKMYPQKFTSREELGEWVCKVGRSKGFGMVTLRSDGGGNSKKRPRVALGCERSGKPDPRLPGPEKKIRKGSGSKKCGCPFILKGQLAADGSGWELTEVKGVHNHAVQNSDFPARLTKEEKSLVKNMHSEKLKPKEILKDLKERDKHNKSTLRTIYNARKSLDWKLTLQRVQQWLSLLSNKLSLHGHIHCDMTCPKTNTRNFFLTNPTSLKLLRAFPSVLKITSGRRFRTDHDRHLCITGITSTEIEFSIAYVYLCSRRRDNLLWVLNRLRDEMDDIAVLRVIVLQIEFRNVGAAPRDLIGLIRAIKDVFRTTEVLLCGSFVTRVLFNAYGRKISFMDLNWTQFLDFKRKLETLVQSPSESEFKKKLTELQTEFKMYPKALDNVTKAWLNPHKEKFVVAWTNKIWHLGIQTLDQLARDHTNFQGQLIDTFWEIHHGWREEIEFESMSEEIHLTHESEHKTICDSFKKSLAAAEIDDFIRFRAELKELIGVVSINALRLVLKQCMQASDVIMSVDCDCAIRCTHGLPCHHEIAKYKRDGRPIPAECIHPHWKTINLPFLTQAVEMMGHHPSETSMDKETKEYIEDGESVESESPIMAECARQPEEKEYHIQTHNAISEFAEAYPASLRDYVREVKDVASDGHCGFRAISSLLGYDDEGGWVKVRKDLIDELSFNKAHYAQLYSSNQRVEELLHSLNYFHSTCLPHKEHWMTMLDIGHVVASCYNVVLMYLSSVQCFTFLPLRTAPISISSPEEIAIGFLNEHFVQVILKQDHPMPPPAPTPTIIKLNMPTDWERFHQQRCREWVNRYTARMEEFKSLQLDDGDYFF